MAVAEFGVFRGGESPCRICLPNAVTPLKSRSLLSGGLVNGDPSAWEKC
jgi:hypothetical protein